MKRYFHIFLVLVGKLGILAILAGMLSTRTGLPFLDLCIVVYSLHTLLLLFNSYYSNVFNSISYAAKLGRLF